MELISILQEYARLERRKGMEVYFDGAPAPQAGTRRIGSITSHFIPLGMTADEAIRKRLRGLGKGARNWKVVSSDRQVQADARSARAEVISSDDFAKIIKRVRDNAPKPSNDRKLSQKEVDDWLKLFERRSRKRY